MPVFKKLAKEETSKETKRIRSKGNQEYWGSIEGPIDIVNHELIVYDFLSCSLNIWYLESNSQLDWDETEFLTSICDWS